MDHASPPAGSHQPKCTARSAGHPFHYSRWTHWLGSRTSHLEPWVTGGHEGSRAPRRSTNAPVNHQVTITKGNVVCVEGVVTYDDRRLCEVTHLCVRLVTWRIERGCLNEMTRERKGGIKGKRPKRYE